MVAGQEPRQLEPPRGPAGPPAAEAGCGSAGWSCPGSACARRRRSGRPARRARRGRSGPDAFRTSRSIGPATSRRNFNRSMAAGVSRPNQAVSPGPWLIGAKARVPAVRGCRPRTPAPSGPIALAIGTTVSCRYAGSSRTSPSASSRSAPLDVLGPPLGNGGRPHRPTQRVARPRAQLDRGTAVQQHPVGHARHEGRRPGRRRPAAAHPGRGGAPLRRSPRRWPATAAPYSCSRASTRSGSPVRRDPPVHLLDRDGLIAHRVGEQRQADVDDRYLVRQHDLAARSHRSSAPPRVRRAPGPGEQEPFGVVEQLPTLRDRRARARRRSDQALADHRLDRCR